MEEEEGEVDDVLERQGSIVVRIGRVVAGQTPRAEEVGEDRLEIPRRGRGAPIAVRIGWPVGFTGNDGSGIRRPRQRSPGLLAGSATSPIPRA